MSMNDFPYIHEFKNTQLRLRTEGKTKMNKVFYRRKNYCSRQ